MNPYDAVFLALAVGLFFKRPKGWWLAALVPAVALVTHWMPLGRFATPITAIIACLLVPRYAPVAVVLAIPIYQDPLDVFRTALLWLALSAVVKGLEDRCGDQLLDSPVRYRSAQLLSVAVLYYTLRPVVFL